MIPPKEFVRKSSEKVFRGYTNEKGKCIGTDDTDSVRKDARNIALCRKKCNDEDGCSGWEFDSSAKQCVLYKGFNIRGLNDGDGTCYVKEDIIAARGADIPLPRPRGEGEMTIDSVRYGICVTSEQQATFKEPKTKDDYKKNEKGI